jgi:hypothetical protein
LKVFQYLETIDAWLSINYSFKKIHLYSTTGLTEREYRLNEGLICGEFSVRSYVGQKQPHDISSFFDKIVVDDQLNKIENESYWVRCHCYYTTLKTLIGKEMAQQIHVYATEKAVGGEPYYIRNGLPSSNKTFVDYSLTDKGFATVRLNLQKGAPYMADVEISHCRDWKGRWVSNQKFEIELTDMDFYSELLVRKSVA